MHNCSFMPTMTDIIDHNKPWSFKCDGLTYLVKCFRHSDWEITSELLRGLYADHEIHIWALQDDEVKNVEWIVMGCGICIYLLNFHWKRVPGFWAMLLSTEQCIISKGEPAIKFIVELELQNRGVTRGKYLFHEVLIKNNNNITSNSGGKFSKKNICCHFLHHLETVPSKRIYRGRWNTDYRYKLIHIIIHMTTGHLNDELHQHWL